MALAHPSRAGSGAFPPRTAAWIRHGPSARARAPTVTGDGLARAPRRAHARARFETQTATHTTRMVTVHDAIVAHTIPHPSHQCTVTIARAHRRDHWHDPVGSNSEFRQDTESINAQPGPPGIAPHPLLRDTHNSPPCCLWR